MDHIECVADIQERQMTRKYGIFSKTCELIDLMVAFILPMLNMYHGGSTQLNKGRFTCIVFLRNLSVRSRMWIFCDTFAHQKNFWWTVGRKILCFSKICELIAMTLAFVVSILNMYHDGCMTEQRFCLFINYKSCCNGKQSHRIHTQTRWTV